MTPPLSVTKKSGFSAVSRRGFNLVEVVIALGILAIVLIPLMASLAVAYQTNREARNHTELALVMQSCDALLRNQKPAALKPRLESGPLILFFADGGQYLGTNSSASNFYRCTVTLSTNRPATTTRLNTIVRVEFPSPAFSESFIYPMGVFNYGSKLP